MHDFDFARDILVWLMDGESSLTITSTISQDCWFTRNHQKPGHESLKQKNAESYFLSLSHFLMAKKAEMHVHSTPLTCS